jgi:hypothetical protein
MTRRLGISLVEVLVAILITGVGLLALLTLFPYGLLETAQAIQADRAGHAKHNAVAFASIIWPNSQPGVPLQFDLRHDPGVMDAMLDPNGTVTTVPYPAITPPPGYYLPSPPNPPKTINPSMSTLASYPVIVDPNGYWANSGAGSAWLDWVAGGPSNTTNPSIVLPRRVSCEPLKPSSQGGLILNNVMGYRRQQLLQWTALLDDIYFPRDSPDAGRPCTPVGAVNRAARYSWTYLCRMPKAVAGGPIYLTVILYAGRTLEQPGSGETAFNATFNSPNLVSLTWNAGQNPPDVSVSGWILDATMPPIASEPRGYFYRVVSIVNIDLINRRMDLEVQLPDGTPKLILPGTNVSGTVVIMDNVIGVFDFKTF